MSFSASTLTPPLGTKIHSGRKTLLNDEHLTNFAGRFPLDSGRMMHRTTLVGEEALA
jgi:hypothetical protein